MGVLTPLTGAGSPYGPGMQKALQMAADDVNAAGGLLGGRSIRLFTEDDETSPEAAVRAAKKLIEVNRVIAILGTWSSGVTMAVVPLTIQAGILEMSTSGAPELTTLQDHNLVFRTQASNALFGVAFARAAKARGFKRAATMAFNNPSGLGNAGEFAKQWKAMGNEVVASVVYQPNQATYRAELQRVLAAKPEVVVMGSYLPDTTIILKEWYQSGEPVKWIGPAWAINQKLIETLGAGVVEGVVAVDAVPDFDHPKYAEWAERLKKATGQDPVANPYAGMCYDMIAVMAPAIEAAGSADPKVFNAQMQRVSGPPGEKVYTIADALAAVRRGRDIDYEGVSSRINFDAAGDVAPKFGVYEVRGGKLVRVDIIDVGA